MSGTAIVTGGSRGIGAATSRLLAADGFAVCVVYRASPKEAEAVVADIAQGGGKAIAVQADTADESDVLRLFETVDRELGTVDALINNAAIYGPRTRFDEVSTTDMRRVMEVNVIGCMMCAGEAIRRMSTKHGGKGGSIVNISSGSALTGAPGSGVLYSASKGALNSFTIGLSQELAGEGIRVNAVTPGLTDTDMPGPERVKRSAPNIPMGRAGEPREIAEAIAWLVSPKASYVAGAILRVGGGLL